MSRKVFFKLIVPNYNNMAYIKMCLDSIVQQTFQNFICVVVDDMSTDMSDKLVEYYERRYPGKVKLIKHTEKKYAGGARNTGLKYDKYEADYIWFIDSDDRLYGNDVLQKMHDKIEKSGNPDILRVGSAWQFKTGLSNKRAYSDLKFIIENTWHAPWWSCISSKFSDITFQEGLPIYNDALWFAKLLDRVDQKKVVELDDQCYIYNRITTTGCHNTLTDGDKREAKKKLEDALTAYKPNTELSQMFIDKILELKCEKKKKEVKKDPPKKFEKLTAAEPKLKQEIKQQANKCFFKIIVPNYNNMSYIKKCIDSVLNQTFQDFKLIIVDDMSTDMSDRFCEVYSRKHSNKMVFIPMKNKGHEGGCRNVGIDYKLDCEYYMFIDGDDWLYNENCLQTLYDNVKDDMPDVLIYCLTQLKNGKYINVIPPKFDWASNNIAFKYSSACTKIIRYNKIQYFLENCDHAADTYFSMKIFNQHPTIKQISDMIYVYNRNNSSVTLNGNYENDTKLFYKNFIQLLENITDENVKRAMLNRIFKYLQNQIDY